MEKPIVSFRNVSKTYSMYRKKSDQLLELFSLNKDKKKFSALNNISFDVNRGETIGIIGVNGSGKSTLSNLLAQVTHPSTGTIKVQGETSLVAISAGLNNFLTGLENIELKCLMHGLTKKEIENIKQDIIEFADIGDFINQPIKSYSSGMKSRLGFAISVHIQPDILVVDEALSVGDSTFYKKCLDKFDEFQAQGKTIFFISHSLSQVQSISDRILWLNFGQIQMFDDKDIVAREYSEFINWFNELNTKEKKEYRENMLKNQVDSEASIAQSKRETRKEKKGWGNVNTAFQFSLLLIYFIIATILMFFDHPLSIITVKDDTHEEVIEEKEAEHINEEIGKPATKEIKQEGFISVRTATIYNDTEFSNELAELPFATKIFIHEEIDNSIYKVDSSHGLGYVNKNIIELQEQSNNRANVSIDTFLPLFPETFQQSYGFFLSFLNVEANFIRQSLQGLTSEYEDDDGNNILAFGNESVSFILNEEDISYGIEITNLTLEDFDIIAEENTLQSIEDGLYYFLTDTYQIYLDTESESIRFITY